MVLKIYHDKVATAPTKFDNGEYFLDLPIENVHKDELPEITVVTITRNRKNFFPLAINNWNRIYYPHDKLFWLVLDDSDTLEDGPVRELKNLKDDRVMYYYLKPEEKNGIKIPYTIGYKRNFAMSLIKTNLVVMLDDDDYMYRESILARVCLLNLYKKHCVYSHELGVYNTCQKSNYILEKFSDIPEGTLMFTKVWWEQQKFNENTTSGEGISLAYGREADMIKIPYMFNIIVLNHDKNYTGRLRSVVFKKHIKKKLATESPINFYNLFDETFKDSMKVCNM